MSADSYVSALSDLFVNSLGSAVGLFSSSENGDPNDYLNLTSGYDSDVDRRIESTIRNLENYQCEVESEQPLMFQLDLTEEPSTSSGVVIDDYLTDGKFIEMEIVLLERAFNIYIHDRCDLLHESGSKFDDITSQREYLIKFYQNRLRFLTEK